jgi:flagellar hook-length control protein FliK
VEQGIRLENAMGQIATSSTIDVSGAAPRSGVSAANGFALAAGPLDGHSGPATNVFVESEDSAPPSVASQAIRGLAAMVNQRGGSMTMRLDPPELGQLRVQMTIVGGNVTAEFTAGTQQTQALLDRHMTALRASLEGQGLTVERLTVHATPAAASTQHAAFRQDDGGASTQQQNQQWSNQHDAGGSESRGRREHAEHAPHRQFDTGDLTFESLFESGELLASSHGAHSSWPV